MLSLMDAVRKSSLMPAQCLETMSPQMTRKGRIRVGADADIAVLVRRASSTRRLCNRQAFDGFRDVFVDGVPVVRDGQLQAGATPGEGIFAR